MIYDCFTWFNEFDILDIRLNELYDTVDKFVIVEANQTFRGVEREPLLLKHRERYEQFWDKIIPICVNLTGKTPWDREVCQRNDIGYGLVDNAQPDDIIMVSDADEIPRATAVATLDPQEITSLKMNEYFYSLNMNSAYYGFTRACYYRDFRGANALRRHWMPDMPEIEDAGWHFSYLNDATGIKEKIQSFSHSELDRPFFTDPDMIKARMMDGKDLFDRFTLNRWEIDDSYPRYVLDNMDYFKKFVL